MRHYLLEAIRMMINFQSQMCSMGKEVVSGCLHRFPICVELASRHDSSLIRHAFSIQNECPILIPNSPRIHQCLRSTSRNTQLLMKV